MRFINLKKVNWKGNVIEFYKTVKMTHRNNSFCNKSVIVFIEIHLFCDDNNNKYKYSRNIFYYKYNTTIL